MPSHALRPRAVPILVLLVALLAPGVAHAADTIVVGLRPGALAATALDAAGGVQVGARAAAARRRRARRSGTPAAPRCGPCDARAPCATPSRCAACRRSPRSRPIPAAPQQWGLDAIGADAAWAVTRGAGVVVAVVDTGVAPAPDLAGRLLPGWNVIARSDDATDDNGHGTHVAGTVAEVEGNGLAESGVAPEASILPVKVLDSTGAGSDVDVAAGIVWAADHGARIVNLSLGGSEASTVLADGVTYARSKGVLIVAAAGNDGGAGRRARASRRRASRSGPWTRTACARRSAPEAGRSISSRPASTSCSRRSTAPAATPSGPGRARRWRRRRSRASPRSPSRPAAPRRPSAWRACSLARRSTSACPVAIRPTAPASCAQTPRSGVAVP